MWTKVFVLIAASVVGVHAMIDGLQNDISIGYSYDSPATIQASLAYYIKIPANEEVADHFAFITRDNNQYSTYNPTRSQYQHSGMPPLDFGGNSLHSRLQTQGHYYTPEQEHNSRYQQQVSYQGPFVPSHYNFPIRSLHSPSISNRYQQSQYQIDPRSRPHNPLPLPDGDSSYDTDYQSRQMAYESAPRNSLNSFHNEDYRRVPTPSQKLEPPPYTPHLSLQVQATSFDSSAPRHFRIVPSMASLPSYNAILPFPIGAVPIKFKTPLPLKTHLKQAGLLPITSYQAIESYRK